MPRVLFTKEEDQKLRNIIEKTYSNNNEINWNFVANQMETKNPRQCRDRWLFYLQNGLNKNKFSNLENFVLLQKVDEFGHKWKIISLFFNNRTEISLKSQYRKLMRHGANLSNVLSLSLDKKKKNKLQQEKKEEQSIVETLHSAFESSNVFEEYELHDFDPVDNFETFYF